MPYKPKSPSSPITMAEKILERLDGVPWPLSAWLEQTRNESTHVHTYRENDPEVERLRTKRLANWIELGVYDHRAAKSDVVADVLDAMGRVR